MKKADATKTSPATAPANEAAASTSLTQPPAFHTLFEISGALSTIVAEIIDAGGEITPEQMAALDQLRGAMAEKCGNICHVLDVLEAQAEMARRIEQQAAAYRQARENTHSRLRSYIAAAMSNTGERRVEAGTRTITLRAGAESVDVFDLNALPLGMTEEVVTVRPKKAEIKAALKDGKDVPGARIVTGQPYVQIK